MQLTSSPSPNRQEVHGPNFEIVSAGSISLRKSRKGTYVGIFAPPLPPPPKVAIDVLSRTTFHAWTWKVSVPTPCTPLPCIRGPPLTTVYSRVLSHINTWLPGVGVKIDWCFFSVQHARTTLLLLLPNMKRVEKFPEVDCVHPALLKVAPHVKTAQPISSCHSMQCHRKPTVQSSETFPLPEPVLTSLRLDPFRKSKRRGRGEEPIVSRCHLPFLPPVP